MKDTNGEAIRARQLRHDYPPGKMGKEPRPALRGVDLDVRRGELFGLLGPNGGGKTTLCRILTTALKPSSGDATVAGCGIAENPAGVRRKIGVVFQHPCLDRKLTIRENLLHQGHLYGLRGAALAERLREMLGRVGLSERADELVENLSGGLKRRTEIAKSLLHRPEVLILDEPTSGLDPGARQDLWNYLRELQKADSVAILVATHLMEEAEKCDRLAIFDKGKVVALGSPASLKSEIGGDVVSIEAQEPEGIREEIRLKFGVEAMPIGNILHIEWPQGHTFVPALIEAFPGRITSVTISKPSLEDVFIHRTRHRFWQEKAE